MDTFNTTDTGFSHYLENGGQRVITALAYLNNVDKGGETSFPSIGKLVSPEKGKIVVFHLCRQGTYDSNPNAFHGALPVLEGEKWAFNLWFRQNKRV